MIRIDFAAKKSAHIKPREREIRGARRVAHGIIDGGLVVEVRVGGLVRERVCHRRVHLTCRCISRQLDRTVREVGLAARSRSMRPRQVRRERWVCFYTRAQYSLEVVSRICRRRFGRDDGCGSGHVESDCKDVSVTRIASRLVALFFRWCVVRVGGGCVKVSLLFLRLDRR